MGSDPSAEYIHMVQHLIEECIVFKMSKEECMEAISKHANIKPIITSTVWNELEKENKEFFEGYSEKKKNNNERGKTTCEETEASQRQGIHKVLFDSPGKDTNDDDR